MHPFQAPPMPVEAAPWPLRALLSGRASVVQLWETVWTEGLWRGVVTGVLACLVIQQTAILITLVATRNRK